MMNNNFNNNPALLAALNQNQAQGMNQVQNNGGFNPSVMGFGVDNTSSSNQRPKAMLWVNVGYEAEFVNSEGVTETTFISLPMGIPLDTTEPVAVRGRDSNWKQIQQAKNALLEQLVAFGKGLEQGNGQVIPNLQVEIRRVYDEEQPATSADGNNPFVKNIFG